MNNVHRIVGIAISLSVPSAFSQAATEAKLFFDVASVKPSEPNARAGLTIQPGGRFVANGFTLQSLIAIAYRVTPFQMSRVEAWVANDRWNIEAKAQGVTSIPSWAAPNIPEIMAARLRALLEERFLLTVHRETRLEPVYDLTIAKSGSKLVSVDRPLPPPADSLNSNQKQLTQRPGSFRAGPGRVIGAAVTMDHIVAYLDRLMDRQVIDKTGLTGYFEIDLKFAPESAPRAPSGPVGVSGSEAKIATDPSIFTAVQEQLGLKLQATKEPIQVLVINSARKPTAN